MSRIVTKNEWLIMEALWKKNPMFLSEITEQMRSVAEWKQTTFATYLKKLTDSGHISYETIKGNRLYSPVLTREQCVAQEATHMNTKYSRDSAHLLIASMIEQSGLSKAGRDEIARLIKNLDERES